MCYLNKYKLHAKYLCMIIRGGREEDLDGCSEIAEKKAITDIFRTDLSKKFQKIVLKRDNICMCRG